MTAIPPRSEPSEPAVVDRFGGDFRRRFFATLAGVHLSRVEEARLVEGSLLLLQLAARREPGVPVIHLLPGSVFIVNDDMPFLVDSVTECLHSLDLEVDRVVHPVMPIARDEEGWITALGEGARESLMQVTLKGGHGVPLADIAPRLEIVLDDVRVAVADWKKMLSATQSLQAKLAGPGGGGEDEDAVFLSWLRDGYFTFLGTRSYDLTADVARPVSGLGILAEKSARVFGISAQENTEAATLLAAPERLVVTKSARISTVHRRLPLDVVAVREPGPDGKPIRLHILAGLFTSRAYARPPEEIPLVRRKVATVEERSGFAANGHAGKLIAQAIGTYPRDELLQMSADELLHASRQLLGLYERPDFGVFLRRDRFNEFASLIIYTPRERFDFGMRQRLEKAALDGLSRSSRLLTSEFSVNAGENLARLHLVVSLDPEALAVLDVAMLEQRLRDEASDWSERLEMLLRREHGDLTPLVDVYAEAFTSPYRERVSPLEAMRDVAALEVLGRRSGSAPLLRAHFPVEKPPAPEMATLTLYHPGMPIPLSDLLPILERFGLRILTEAAYRVSPAGRQAVALQSLAVEISCGGSLVDCSARLAEAFEEIWRGEAEGDRFNTLVLSEGLHGRQVAVLRAFAKYLRQARFRFTQEAIESSFIAYPALGRLCVQLFETLHDPKARGGADERAAVTETAILAALEKVGNADDDAIFRAFLALIRATLRTNYFRVGEDGRPSQELAFKIDSQAVATLLPPPAPLVEIFVYSARFEAVHLRGGKIARGGIRWSDRREDFRTEILGLMKAQMVKNTVIVPVGSKGGFVLKRPPATGGRAALQEEGIACYRLMMRALLALTDNLAYDGTVIPPQNVVRHDGDDPYLVVAADKGTASFSDYANGVSREYGFWLDDAFASGGSSGYDHKKMAITARGAWESVKRHFRERGRDSQRQPFTVAGVGDMSGDVFGNAMLQSEAIRLVAAFDHRHIFLDPAPDMAASYAERQRLFTLSGSSWDEYDRTKLSSGGGVFPRSLKAINLTPEMRTVLDVTAERLSPSELIRAILRAPVDLLFLGGIGTYVKAAEEANGDVGDRANDATRIDGAELRAAVIGEGANLGCTQRGRIEFAARGGRINTDFIDNSAGVDTSDHEVNIKILMKPLLDTGKLTLAARDELLASMTTDVAALVLTDNYQQTQTLSRLDARAGASFEADVRFMRALERQGLLNRAIESLPDDDEIAARAAAGKGLTRPELAVILAYSKITAYEQLLASGFTPDAFDAMLDAYFPGALQANYARQIATHKLRREIVMTRVVNEVINRAGPTFLHDMQTRTGAAPGAVVAAFLRTSEAFGLPDIWAEIEALDGTVPPREQIRMQLATEALLGRILPRLLRPGVIEVVEVGADRLSVAAMANAVTLGDEATQREIEIIPPRFRRLSLFPHLTPALDLTELARDSGLDLDSLARIHVGVTRRFAVSWLANAAATLPYSTDYERRAADALIDEAFDRAQELTRRIVVLGTSRAAVEQFAERYAPEVARLDAVLTEAKAAQTPTLPLLMLVASETRRLVQAARG